MVEVVHSLLSCSLFNAFSPVVFLNLFVHFVFDYLPWLFPIACFVSTLFTFSFLTKNRELLALDASGVSTLFLARPIFILALVCSILCWLSKDAEKIIDWFEDPLKSNLDRKKELVSSIRMRLESENRTWYFQSFDLGNRIAKEIHLYSYDKAGNDLFRIKAKSGNLSKKGWELKDGKFLGFYSDKGMPAIDDKNHIFWDLTAKPYLNSLELEKKSPRFNKKFSYLHMSNIHDNPRPFALLKTKPEDLSFGSLNELIDRFPSPFSAKLYPYKLRRAQLFWNAPACILAVMCAMALSIRREQTTVGFIVGLSFLWILAFYVVRAFCDAIGEKGILSEWIATGIPFIFLLITSIKMLWDNR